MSRLPLVSILTLLLFAAAPAAADSTFYSWTTDDGGLAFADDERSIPPRYRKRAVARPAPDLSDYDRFTPQLKRDGARYQDHLAQRLAHLRAFNAAADAEIRSARRAPHPSSSVLSISTGDETSPRVDLSAGAGDEPMVIETLHTRPSGSAVTRSSVVVRQGDRTLAIVKPRPREINVTDIVDEEDLER